MQFLDYEGVKYLWGKITALVNTAKSDVSALKINGKALSGNPTLTASDVSAIATSAKGVAGGVASLGSDGKVPSSQLPSYVDDVLEYNGKANFPATGETGKIYVDTATNLTYRWSGSAYVEISPSLALGETSSTAFAGDKGKTAYTHATDGDGTTAVAAGLYKVGVTAHGHALIGAAVTKSDITALGVPASDTNTAHGHTAGAGLTISGSGGTSGTTTYAAKLKDTTANANDSAKSTSTNGGLYAVEVDKSGYLAVRVPWVNTQGKDTTYSAGVGLTLSGTEFKAKLNSETSLGTIGTTSRLYAVGVDANGKLAVSVPWTDNNTTYSVATTSANGLMSSADKTKLNAVASGATADSALTTSDIDAAIAEAEA